MTLDLDELERKAKAAEWRDDSEPKTYEHFVAVERFQEAVTAPLILALIERVRLAENVGTEWMALQKAAGFPNDGMTRGVKDVSDAVVLMAERVREVESAIRLNADAFDESDLRRLGVTEDA